MSIGFFTFFVFVSLTALCHIPKGSRHFGPKVLKVLRFDSACGAEGCGIALRAISIIIPLRGMENHTTGLPPRKCTPYSPTGTSPKGKHVTGFSGRFAPLQIQFASATPVPLPPRRGKFALCLPLISYSITCISANLPPSVATLYPAAPDFSTGKAAISHPLKPAELVNLRNDWHSSQTSLAI